MLTAARHSFSRTNSAMDPILVITGPTASGKESLAFELAGRLGAEIVSLDSMKVYRELDIGTAKPSPLHRQAVRYHLIDFVSPDTDFSTGEYLCRLEAVLDELETRSTPAILCGGTALYLKSFLDGFRDGPAADWGFRRQLMREAAAQGSESLHVRLAAIDRASAERIHATDLRRLVRALEIHKQTGELPSARREWGDRPGERRRPARIFGIQWDRETLYERINRRVECMVDAGLFDEIRRARGRRSPLSRSALQVIGYKEVIAGWEAGETEAEIIARVQQSTRRFAKRQLTWFRKMPIEWIASGAADPGQWADDVLRRLGRGA